MARTWHMHTRGAKPYSALQGQRSNNSINQYSFNQQMIDIDATLKSVIVYGGVDEDIAFLEVK